jgi:hypothetical protein
VGAGFYTLWNVWKGQHKPHAFSIIIWIIMTAIACVNFNFQGATDASYRLLLMVFILCCNLFLTLRHGLDYITKPDKFLFCASLLTIPVWIVTDNPQLALFWLLFIELTATIPTLLKAYVQPFTMRSDIYFLTATAQSLQCLAYLTAPDQKSMSVILYMGLFPLIFYALAILIWARRKSNVI